MQNEVHNVFVCQSCCRAFDSLHVARRGRHFPSVLTLLWMPWLEQPGRTTPLRRPYNAWRGSSSNSRGSPPYARSITFFSSGFPLSKMNPLQASRQSQPQQVSIVGQTRAIRHSKSQGTCTDFAHQLAQAHDDLHSPASSLKCKSFRCATTATTAATWEPTKSCLQC